MTPSEARNVLGLHPTVELTRRDIADAYRANVKHTHPDTGGNPDEFVTAQRAAAVLRENPHPPRRMRRFSADDFDLNERLRVITDRLDLAGNQMRASFENVRVGSVDGGIRIDGLPPASSVVVTPRGVTVHAPGGWMTIDEFGNRSYGTAAGDTGTQ